MYSIEIDGKHISFDHNGEVLKAWEFSEFLDQDVEITQPLQARQLVLKTLPYASLCQSEKNFLNNIADWFTKAVERSRYELAERAIEEWKSNLNQRIG